MIKNIITKFIIGFTIGYITVGMFITTARTAKHNMDFYKMEMRND